MRSYFRIRTKILSEKPGKNTAGKARPEIVLEFCLLLFISETKDERYESQQVSQANKKNIVEYNISVEYRQTI